VTPILGSMSDRCKLKQGRRRPFILLLALGVFIGKFEMLSIVRVFFQAKEIFNQYEVIVTEHCLIVVVNLI